MLENFSGLNPKGPYLSLEKRKRNFLCCAHLPHKAKKSVMHVQSWFFANLTLFFWAVRRRRCRNSLLLSSRNFATMVTWRPNKIKRKGYDVIGVNIFPRKLMRFPRQYPYTATVQCLFNHYVIWWLHLDATPRNCKKNLKDLTKWNSFSAENMVTYGFFSNFHSGFEGLKKRRGIHFNKYFKFYLQLKSEYCNKHFP